MRISNIKLIKESTFSNDRKMDILYKYYKLTSDLQGLRNILQSIAKKDITEYSDARILDISTRQKDKITRILSKKSLTIQCKRHGNRSLNGLSTDILKSGVQKYCRRNNPEKAMWCAIELDLFKYAPETESALEKKALHTNFIHRLMVVYLEDVSLGNVNGLLQLDKLLENPTVRTEWSPVKRMRNILNAIKILCVSDHTRIISHYKSVFNFLTKEKLELAEKFYPTIAGIYQQTNKKQDTTLKIPSGLVEKYKANPEYVKTFLGYLENKNDLCIYWVRKILEDIEENRTKGDRKSQNLIWSLLEFFIKEKAPYLKVHLDICLKWWKNELQNNTRDEFLCFYFIIIAFLRYDSLNLKHPEIQKISKEDSILAYGKNLSGQKITIDDYIIDMHTREGKLQGNDKLTFAEQGSTVLNESPITNQTYKSFYNNMKRIESGNDPVDVYPDSKLESELFTFRIRAQIICASTRPDTYYAIEKKNDRKIFVKGPYMSKEKANIPYSLNEIKKQLYTLNTYEMVITDMIPDMFEDPPFGTRTHLDRNKPHTFLVCEDLVCIDKFPTKIKNTVKWKDTKVVDWEKVTVVSHITDNALADPKILTQYVVCLFYRYIFGVGDLADRNFLIVNGKVYSVDEEMIGHPVIISTSIRKITQKNTISKFIRKNRTVLEETLDLWKQSVKEGHIDTLLDRVGISRSFITERIKSLKYSMDTFTELAG